MDPPFSKEEISSRRYARTPRFMYLDDIDTGEEDSRRQRGSFGNSSAHHADNDTLEEDADTSCESISVEGNTDEREAKNEVENQDDGKNSTRLSVNDCDKVLTMNETCKKVEVAGAPIDVTTTTANTVARSGANIHTSNTKPTSRRVTFGNPTLDDGGDRIDAGAGARVRVGVAAEYKDHVTVDKVSTVRRKLSSGSRKDRTLRERDGGRGRRERDRRDKEQRMRAPSNSVGAHTKHMKNMKNGKIVGGERDRQRHVHQIARNRDRYRKSERERRRNLLNQQGDYAGMRGNRFRFGDRLGNSKRGYQSVSSDPSSSSSSSSEFELEMDPLLLLSMPPIRHAISTQQQLQQSASYASMYPSYVHAQAHTYAYGQPQSMPYHPNAHAVSLAQQQQQQQEQQSALALAYSQARANGDSVNNGGSDGTTMGKRERETTDGNDMGLNMAMSAEGGMSAIPSLPRYESYPYSNSQQQITLRTLANAAAAASSNSIAGITPNMQQLIDMNINDPAFLQQQSGGGGNMYPEFTGHTHANSLGQQKPFSSYGYGHPYSNRQMQYENMRQSSSASSSSLESQKQGHPSMYASAALMAELVNKKKMKKSKSKDQLMQQMSADNRLDRTVGHPSMYASQAMMQELLRAKSAAGKSKNKHKHKHKSKNAGENQDDHMFYRPNKSSADQLDAPLLSKRNG